MAAGLKRGTCSGLNRLRFLSDPGLGDKTEVYRLRRFISPEVRGLGGVTVTPLRRSPVRWPHMKQRWK